MNIPHRERARAVATNQPRPLKAVVLFACSTLALSSAVAQTNGTRPAKGKSAVGHARSAPLAEESAATKLNTLQRQVAEQGQQIDTLKQSMTEQESKYEGLRRSWTV